MQVSKRSVSEESRPSPAHTHAHTTDSQLTSSRTRPTSTAKPLQTITPMPVGRDCVRGYPCRCSSTRTTHSPPRLSSAQRRECVMSTRVRAAAAGNLGSCCRETSRGPPA
ncbi:hypothetical protein Micbo1qcDRAFT_169333, partial [Microdochium bolleyi]